MIQATDQARLEVQANAPEVETAQVWIRRDDGDEAYPPLVRVVCRYPFGQAGDGRLWIIEPFGGLGSLMRCPELTLRSIYKLTQTTP